MRRSRACRHSAAMFPVEIEIAGILPFKDASRFVSERVS